MFDKVFELWRETFPKREHNLMRIEYVAAIEEFNEYFPGYAAMNDKNYDKLQRYIRILRPIYCIPTLRKAFSAAFALENSIDEYLERNVQYKRKGLTGEWAIQIFTDHNDHIIERYREYKKQRLEKLARTFEERKKKADKIAQRNEFRLKWLLGREGFYEYNKSRLAVMEKEQALTGKNLAARKEAQKNARPVISYDY
ncbi:hypothetical protein CRE_27481 [Caenorhabditis remanei]|uniref:Uncharacterized protein n=1 Tax=Caenorhabditis remanei TaxID=31234 RepID=E3LNU5_CAERE|nr:hypothetical protein CRE_27481 [Caenorhabditis remanei]